MSEWTSTIFIIALSAVIFCSNICASVPKQWELLDVDNMQDMENDTKHGNLELQKPRNKRDGTSVEKYSAAKNINYTKFYARVVGNKCLLTVNKTQEEVERAEEEEEENVANGKIHVFEVKSQDNEKQQKRQRPDTLIAFHRIVMTPESCGHRQFDTSSYCTKLNFYGLGGIEGAQQFFGKGKTKEEIKGMDEFDKRGFMQDMVLLLLDGCISCENASGKNSDVNITAVRYLKPGFLPDSHCGGYWHRYDQYNVKLNDGKGSFAYRVLLMERLCPMVNKMGVAANKSNLIMQPPEYKFENVHINIMHSCAGGEPKNITIHIPTIDKFEKKMMINDHVMQIRDIHLHLDNLEPETELDLSDTNHIRSGVGQYISAKLVGPKKG
ncbi:hypothetical protein niasHT_024723 [Heterodera trifolii]|uniref:Uncharacterized protein n=1 Tax=Heterodera trifolii TaxID=157864 RepID=A0ABD2K0P1_9BILA